MMTLVSPLLMHSKLSTNHAIADISRKSFDLWTTPVKPDLKLIKGYLEKPLDSDWKIPLSHFEWKKLLVSEEFPDHACYDQDLELLFKQCEEETVDAIQEQLKMVIINGPLDSGVLKIPLHAFWDTCDSRAVEDGNYKWSTRLGGTEDSTSCILGYHELRA